MVASLTEAGTLRSVAGGGDTVSALRHAGVMGKMSYVSTAGGAFLEWLEGKMLPGIQALDRPGRHRACRADIQHPPGLKPLLKGCRGIIPA